MSSPGVTLTGTLQSISGAADQAQVIVTLVNWVDNPPRISGTMMLSEITQTVLCNSSGAFSVNLYGNYQLTPANTYYQIQVIPNGASGPSWAAIYQFNSAGSFDISTQVPLQTIVLAPPSANGAQYINGVWVQGNPVGANQVLTSTSSTAASWQAAPPTALYIDAVGDFGADNTGTVSAVTAINNAIAAASSGGASKKAVIFFRPGIYLIDSTITLTSSNNGVRLLGAAPATIDTLGNMAELKVKSGSGVTTMFSNQSHTGLQDFVWENLRLNGNGIASHGLYLDTTVQCEIKGCDFTGFTQVGTTTITATAVTSNEITVTCSNGFSKNDVLAIYGVGTETYLNGAALTADSVSSSQFTAGLNQHFTSSNYSTTSDTGTVLKMGACIIGGSNLYTKIHDNIFHAVTNCYSILFQTSYGTGVSGYGLNDGWIEKNLDYTTHYMRVGGDVYFNHGDFEGSPLVGCLACIDQSDETTGAGNCKTVVNGNYFELSTAGTNPAVYRRCVYFTFEGDTCSCINNTMFGGSTHAGVTRNAIETNVEVLGCTITGNSIRDWDTGIVITNIGAAKWSELHIHGNYLEGATLTTPISGITTSGIDNHLGSTYQGQSIFSDRFYFSGHSVNLGVSNVLTTDTTLDMTTGNVFVFGGGSDTTLTGVTNLVNGGFFWILATTSHLTLTNGSSAFNLSAGSNYNLSAGQVLAFVVANGKVYEVSHSA